MSKESETDTYINKLKEYTYKGKTEEFISLYKEFDAADHSSAYTFANSNLGFAAGLAAVPEGAGGVIDYLLDTVHVDVNHSDSQGRTALHFAVNHSNLAFIKKLVAHHADPDLQDMFGNTVIHYFAEGSNNPDEVLELLLRAGGNLSITNKNGALPAHKAAGSSLEILHAIVQADDAFDVNAKDNDNDTLLHYAAQSETGSICTYLMLLGADATLKNNSGEVAAITADNCDPSGVDNAAILGFDASQYDYGAEGFYIHTLEAAGESGDEASI